MKINKKIKVLSENVGVMSSKVGTINVQGIRHVIKPTKLP